MNIEQVMTPLQRIATVFRYDPMRFIKTFWPQVKLYQKQQEIIESVRDNDETIVPAGHQLGKDFVGGLVALWYFMVHHPVRVITTSVKDDHLVVLWGEIGRFIDTCAFPLKSKDGGPLIVKHREIRKLAPRYLIDPAQPNPWHPEPIIAPQHNPIEMCKISYLKGMVSEKGEGMAGHHAPYTLLIVDEASGVEDEVYRRASTWAKRLLIIGNPYTPSNGPSYFERMVDAGDKIKEE
jgi:hypothetical protein